MINRLKDIVDGAYLGGQFTSSSFRKVPAIASVQTAVVDFSMSPGNPRPNFYTGNALEATLFNYRYGLWHGGDVSPKTKFLRGLSGLSINAGIVPAEMYLLDYLMFYPLIDMDSTNDQTLTNTIDDPIVPSLPRYSDGVGVRAFLVATNPYVGGAQFYLTYTNDKGESGRKTQLITTNTHTFIGTIVHSGATAGLHGTFIATQNGEGIRSVEAITFMSPNGGLAALVLCKVMSNIFIREITAPSEWDLLTMKNELPIIKDGAYLNLIGQVNGSVSGQLLTGILETIWV
jgi:hypothetical protein